MWDRHAELIFRCVYKIPNIKSNTRVSTAERMIEPRQPRRLEKKRNTDTSAKFKRVEGMQMENRRA
jgi:hypothetical protein